MLEDTATAAPALDQAPKLEPLVITSKIKKYAKAKYGLNTAAAVIDVLTLKVIEMLDTAAAKAKDDRRKTLMDRDFSA